MTATIGRLLDRLHKTAYDLDPNGAPQPAEVAHLAAGWSALSSRLEAALSALPYDIDGVGEAQRDHYLSMLRPLHGPTRNTTTPDPRLEDATLIVGAIADLLVTNRPPFQVQAPEKWFYTNAKVYPPVYQWRDRDDPGATGLQSNLLAATYAIGQWTLQRLEANHAPATRFARSIRHVVALCQYEAQSDPETRRGGLDHISATPLDEPSLLGAFARWADEAEQALFRRMVTSGTLAMLASDMAILTAATGHITRAGTTAGDRGVSEELIGAIAGWKKIAAWPTDIRMGGPRARDYISASRELRSYVSADLRGPSGWHEPAQLRQLYTVDHLDTLAYTLAHRSAWVGEALNKTVRDLAIGQGRLWITTDKAREMDPEFYRIRWVAQPDGAPAVGVPVDWHILTRPTPEAIDLAETSRQAAKHQLVAARHIKSGLGTRRHQYETAHGLALTRDRIRIQPSVAIGLGSQRTAGPER